MSLKLHVFWRLIAISCLFLASWFFLWGFFNEIYVWQKNFVDAVSSSWWNWLGFALSMVGAVFASIIDDLVDKECYDPQFRA